MIEAAGRRGNHDAAEVAAFQLHDASRFPDPRLGGRALYGALDGRCRLTMYFLHEPFPARRAMNEWEAILRTIAALAAGGVIGLERSYHGRAAGLRTYALVSFGSALLVAGGQYELFSTRDSGEVTRIIQGIVTGIGFLGAGVIVKEGFSVRGLTTAESIWVASAIGIV